MSTVSQFKLVVALLFLHLGKALAAINRSVVSRLERHLSLGATGGADGGVHLSLLLGSILSGVTARLASLGLILEPSLGIKVLLTGSEHELRATVFAHLGFVFVHSFSLALVSFAPNNMVAYFHTACGSNEPSFRLIRWIALSTDFTGLLTCKAIS